MSLSSLLSRWQIDVTIAENITAWQILPPRQAQIEPIPGDLHPLLKVALLERGISSLYTHQAEAWRIARSQEHVAVVTGTASGKTLCFNLPVLDLLLSDPQSRVLYLYPTKALAQDQLSVVRDLLTTIQRAVPSWGKSQLGDPGTVKPGIYDGDTPASQRQAIRNNARLIISNPDMLHTGILPHHTVWSEFFRNLRFVVIDEMHTYRGVFGSHFANVLRRLRRIAAFYNAHPQFILTSATIANPQQLAEKLVESPVRIIDQDGSRRGEKHFLVYNPPVIDRELGIRKSLTQECVRLATDLVTSDVQTILFGRTRRTIEVILRYLKTVSGDDNAEIIRGYRSGYLAAHRREIEQGLRSGKVRAVVATSALELGVDIGQMEAAVLAGYPGTIASTWQQAGRAGRGEVPALSVLVTSANPLDQFLARHPDYFFKRTPEQALINPDNPLILLGHLRCAAFELPFQKTTEGALFGNLPPELVQQYLDFLQQQGVLHQSAARYFWMSDQYPAQGISLRSAGGENVVLQTCAEGRSQTIGIVDLPSATFFTHPGAVYLHEGVSYIVETLDLENHLAQLSPVEPDYYTEPQSESTVTCLEQILRVETSVGSKAYGEIQVTSQLKGFRKIRWGTGETLGQEPLDLPPMVLQTMGYWLALSRESVENLIDRNLWSNSPNDYGPFWGRIRLQVRKRDHYCCQVCGVSESEGRTHDVHHKVPFRSFSNAEQANQFSNLITLCPACHRRAESAVRMRSGLAGLAYALSNLAPLFVMCDSRDLGVHADPQSTLADGQPAIVLYDRIPAGIGLAESLYQQHDELLLRARELIGACECTDGCPSCVGPGGESGYGSKREALAIVDLLVLSNNKSLKHDEYK
jgi:DEAD/DEAH box helicase domain-containing protein